ncbi:MAG: 2Fe-2S iron-sulfur cluster binding domain-containing protein [Gammaproteobacteria bacterium]|nr:2Fe-2S iron-sulfur cluster binding domain-containing protein [Gammaproteobacteria bacterium]
MYTVNIEQWHTPVTIRKGTILEAALSQGVPYPHNCRAGECGNCKARLLSGQVSHEPCFKEALSDTERGEGYILACRAIPKTDLDISWIDSQELEDTLPVKQMTGELVELKPVAHNVSKLGIRTDDSPLAFFPGQYARLKFKGLPERSYSMANIPNEQI